MTNGEFILCMTIYVLGSGMGTGLSIDHFKKGHYCRFGIFLSYAISVILLMVKTIFSF